MLDFTKISQTFSTFKDLKILVLGDLMVDTYLWGNVERISPEAPVPIVDIEREEDKLGGAGNVINNLISLKANVYIASVIDNNETGSILIKMLNDSKINTAGIIRDAEKKSSRKIRIISSSNNQQLLRIDNETRNFISGENAQKIIDYVSANIKNIDAIIISDYLKGVVSPDLTPQIIKIANEHNKPTIIDPKGKDYRKYQRATIITPNKSEAELATGIKIVDQDSLLTAGKNLLNELNLQSLLITLGKDGMALFQPGKEMKHIPAKAKEVFDVTGAGDTVVSVLGLCIASGLDLLESATVSNIAASIVVGRFGAATVETAEILKAIDGGKYISLNKTIGLEELLPIVKREKDKGKTIVFTNGCFDLLHAGHTDYLQKARSFGDLLILGLNSDDSIKRLKGEKRPIIAQAQRAAILSALHCVDYIVIFGEDTPFKLVDAIKPHILVKGKDYENKEVVGRDIVEQNGGRVELVEFVNGISTSTIINNIGVGAKREASAGREDT